MLAPLDPRLTFDALHPRDSVFMARSTLERTRWLELSAWRLDALTGSTLACMGSMPLVCHEGVATEAVLAFMQLAGLPKPQSLVLYRSQPEAVERARELAAAGRKLAYIYPPPPGADAAEMLLVPLDLYGRLNSKARLAEFVAPEHRPRRRVVAPAEIDGLLAAWPGRPVFVKAAIEGANGAGRDVRYCASAADWEAALGWMLRERAHLDAIVVEDALRFVSTWCLNFAALANGCLYLGAAEQLFSSVGRQSGSRIDPRHAPPERAVAVAQAIAEKARDLGYRGVCGFDVGVDADGRIFVFDLNFRLNSSTPQVLLHDAAVRRIGAAVSQSCMFVFTRPLHAALERLRPHAEAGRFVPFRIFDAALAESPEARGIVTGMLLAADSGAACALEAGISAALAGD